MRPIAKASLLFLLLLAAADAFALDPRKAITQYSLDVWQSDHGLPQNSVMAIRQTRDGYLWLGTEEGLVRFDGVDFKVFDTSNTPAIVHQRIRAITEDRSGTLWIGTLGGGLALLRDGTGISGPNQGMASDQIYFIHEDARGDFWIGTESGLHRRHGGAWQVFTTQEGLPDDNVWCMLEDRDGTLWFGTSQGIARYSDGRMSRPKFTGLPDPSVRALLRDRAGNLFAGTEGGLARLSGDRFTAFSGANAPLGSVIYALLEDRDGNLWAATSNGVSRMFEGHFANLSTQNGLPDDTVLSIYEDREGIIWLGTNSGGLVRLKDTRFTTLTPVEGLSDNVTWSIHQDAQGAVWIATHRGLSRWKDGKFRVYTKTDGLADNGVGAVFTDRTGTTWAGTNAGLSRLRNGTWRTFTTRDGLANDVIRSLYEDRQGMLWIGTRNGLSMMKGDRLLPAFTTRDGLSANNVLFIHQDRTGRVWAGTASGLNELRDGRFISYGVKDGLSSAIMLSVYEDAGGVIYFGTADGLTRYQNGRFTSFTQRDGLFSDAILTILEDDRGRMWFGSNKGVFYVEKKQFDELQSAKRSLLEPVVFGKSNGMKVAECDGGYQPSGWKTTDGRLWFPTIRGVAIADPARESLPPPVLIQAMRVNRRDVALKGAVPGAITLPSGGGDVEFDYAGMSFKAPEQIRYRYKLENVDHDWVDAGGRRQAFYTLVPPGHYRFLVKAGSHDGVWNETAAEIAFDLPPHIYQTLWFRVLAVLALLTLGPAIYALRVRALKLHQRELLHLVEERTQQLRDANEELLRLSSTDELTGIANYRQFRMVLDQEWRRASRSGAPVSLLMLDVDHFKQYNDTHGHPAGDERLRLVAAVLQENAHRASDLAARYGGEEFAVVLGGTQAEGALMIAERIRGAIAGLGDPPVTASFGVATMSPTEENTPDQLISAADASLYRAKQDGRNCVRCAA